MTYTEQEEKELNSQLKSWQAKQLKIVQNSNNFEYACEHTIELERQVWEIIANAKSHKDVNWLVWRNADEVINKFKKLAK